MTVLLALCVLSGASWIVVAQHPISSNGRSIPPKRIDLTRHEAQIREFEAADKIAPPPLGTIVFTGSSSVRQWHKYLAADFDGMNVLGRGFGGSTMPELLNYMDRIVLPYKPAAVIVYEGDNDLTAGRTVEDILDDYREFHARLERELPECRMFVLAIKPSPSRENLWGLARETNARLAEWSKSESNVTFVDVATPMLDDHGKPRSELFLRDRLHMNREGYKLWHDTIEPYLTKLGRPRKSRSTRS